MKAWWIKQAERIDALSLRERMFLFFSVLLVLLATVDVLWLTPVQAAYKQAQQSHAAQNAELVRLRTELAGLAKPNDPGQALREQIAQSEQRLTNLRQEIDVLAPAGSATGGHALEAVLVQFLQRRPGLRLVSSGTVAVDDKASGTPAVPGIVRRGLQLKVTGSYAELARYVKTLEQALPRLRWGAMQLVVDKQVPELTLQVFVLEVQP